MDTNCHILCQLLMNDCKDPSLSTKLDEIWIYIHDEGRFNLLNGILYHRAENTCVMTLTDRVLIDTIIHKCPDSVVSGNLSEDRKLEILKHPLGVQIGERRKDVAESFQTCDRFQKENRATGKKSGMRIQIQDPNSH
ncbi:hypothetical protein O181_092469 [Austropuccinia psidii MF-1]|uniref:Uncharacterized protein n=1 Tax=Austropuccinia psidii MF-1 TaxID=1389203 RepID=A0A9Q3P8W9_9BASI|nr:hypothetical protein [Austropuccinia psidii MF-1]